MSETYPGGTVRPAGGSRPVTTTFDDRHSAEQHPADRYSADRHSTDRQRTDRHEAVLRENAELRAELAETRSALADLRERFALLAQAQPVDDPRPALREVATLTRLLRSLEAEQVQAALARGFSYAEIAAELGVSRQSVHQKHPRRGSGTPAED